MTIGQQNQGTDAGNADLPRGCARLTLQPRGDERGNLIAIEALADIPFAIRRVYFIYGTDPAVTRGHHAHRDLSQLLIATSGACTVRVTDGRNEALVRLDDPAQALLIEGLIWREMADFSEDCVLLVLADAPYDEREYIRDFKEFRALAKDRG